MPLFCPTSSQLHLLSTAPYKAHNHVRYLVPSVGVLVPSVGVLVPSVGVLVPSVGVLVLSVGV